MLVARDLSLGQNFQVGLPTGDKRSHVPPPEVTILITEAPCVVHRPECSKPPFTFLSQERS